MERLFREYGLNPHQFAIWERIVGTQPPAIPGLEIEATTSPVFASEIFNNDLLMPFGLLQHTVTAPDAPRIASLLRVDAKAVAHALLIPTTAEHCEAHPPAERYGDLLGILSVYVDPAHQGRGYAKACLAAIDATLAPALDAQPVSLIGATYALPLMRPLFRVPVLARWDHDRARDERGPGLSQATLLLAQRSR